MSSTFPLGLDTFGDVTSDDGSLLPQARVLRDVVAEAVLADQVGLDAFGVGEHHRRDFAVSAPEVVLAAIAAGPSGSARLGGHGAEHGRSGSRVSALLDGRRALERARRGDPRARLVHRVVSLFGYDLSRYEELFEDKLALFVELLKPGPVTWTGRRARPLEKQTVYPPIEPARCDVDWRRRQPAVGLRAARYGLP